LKAEPRPSALFLAAEAPYPLAGGGALRSASLLNYLARDHDVDMIVFHQPGDPDPAAQTPPGLLRRIVPIELPATGRGTVSRALRNAVRLGRGIPPLVDRFSGFGGRIAQAVAGRQYQIGVVEHFWCAPYWDEISPVCERTALDLHNIESVLHSRCAQAEKGAAGLAHRAFGEACLELEHLWLPRYSCVLAASEHDAGLARGIAPGAQVEAYPNAIPLCPLPARLDEDAIVFSGNMEYHPNVSAVRFFRENVWPRLRERWPRLVWRLVGKNPGAVKQYASGDSRIELAGPVNDAVRELARARAAVVPLLAGSGTRFKILEAWAAGIPVVSTTIGAEGLPVREGENILLADSGPAFAEALTRLLASPSLRERMGMAGRRSQVEGFTWERAWRGLQL
jgi:glycosyltransferase involved in cell wall biosynthesis